MWNNAPSSEFSKRKVNDRSTFTYTWMRAVSDVGCMDIKKDAANFRKVARKCTTKKEVKYREFRTGLWQNSRTSCARIDDRLSENLHNWSLSSQRHIKSRDFEWKIEVTGKVCVGRMPKMLTEDHERQQVSWLLQNFSSDMLRKWKICGTLLLQARRRVFIYFTLETKKI